jgi:hypothetical protein
LAGRGAIPTANMAGYEINEVMPPADPSAPANTPAPTNSAMSVVGTMAVTVSSPP